VAGIFLYQAKAKAKNEACLLQLQMGVNMQSTMYCVSTVNL
jgi:hypothetical protein